MKAIASDQKNFRSEVDLYLHVIDMNDHFPRFESDHYVMNVREDIQVGQVITQLTVFDKDIGKSIIYCTPK